MKITKNTLKKLIKEEMAGALKEGIVMQPDSVKFLKGEGFVAGYTPMRRGGIAKKWLAQFKQGKTNYEKSDAMKKFDDAFWEALVNAGLVALYAREPKMPMSALGGEWETLGRALGEPGEPEAETK